MPNQPKAWSFLEEERECVKCHEVKVFKGRKTVCFQCKVGRRNERYDKSYKARLKRQGV